MIDTGCQVTILSTTVFEHMCTVDPAVRSALRPCHRRLVSADSSPLIVQGQLELNIMFPGLCCDMLFVLTVYWAQRLYSPTYHTNWICVQVSCGQMDDGWLHQQRLTPDLDGLLTTFSVSGIRPHGCALFEPARCLTEEYGVVVGHTLVDASSCSSRVLIINPNAEVVVLPGLTLIERLEEVLCRLSNFGLQLKAKKCTRLWAI